ncbi:hypothetical protein K431DRAFT_286211 [Polychaeton citri CBS 116435]|uniref:Uncharacterized protein n=1 Tax=Polychaeton citri CBS 116435 TaxID=1314669 RepID=A0A9P4UMW7_9PEZI|nr:hypothetical protein K431DRAFT_286211 [Polychaeton citri CBS 116435]
MRSKVSLIPTLVRSQTQRHPFCIALFACSRGQGCASDGGIERLLAWSPRPRIIATSSTVFDQYRSGQSLPGVLRYMQDRCLCGCNATVTCHSA